MNNFRLHQIKIDEALAEELSLKNVQLLPVSLFLCFLNQLNIYYRYFMITRGFPMKSLRRLKFALNIMHEITKYQLLKWNFKIQ